jgi:UPF0176 protein
LTRNAYSARCSAMKYIVIALYHFFDFPHGADIRSAIKAEFVKLGVKGTLLVTPEGINGTLAGTRQAVDDLIAYLQKDVVGGAFEYKESLCDYQPFARTKVKLKKETISLGESAPLLKRGHYVNSREWDDLIADPDTLVIDTRNAYEVELGTFAGATNPQIANFKQLPEYVRANVNKPKHTKIATFCTGGIRCEKFTAWLVDQGYKNVYHLKGGILKYIEETPPAKSKWQGQCFVFDQRVAVDLTLTPLRPRL